MNGNWRTFSWLLMLVLSTPAVAWTLQSAPDDPVQVWTRDLADKPYRLVRAEVTINAPIRRLLTLLQDADSQTRWLPYAQKVTVARRPSPNQTLVRFQTRARWPFNARDAVTLFTVSQPDPRQIRIDMQNDPDAIPPVEGVVRIRQAEGSWTLTALPGCRTRVRYQAGNRWGGNVPQWLVNRLNVRISREALQQLQQWAPAHIIQYPPSTIVSKVLLHEHCD